MKEATVLIDVREDIRTGHEPFSRIMNAVAGLGPEQQLLLVAPFEPVPLVSLLRNQGFRHSAKPIQGGGWEVLFVRDQALDGKVSSPSPASPLARPVAPRVNFIDLDARALEPPQPMVKILETLASLPEETELRARTDRRPLHLYAQLEERGFGSQTVEQDDGSFLTYIRRA